MAELTAQEAERRVENRFASFIRLQFLGAPEIILSNAARLVREAADALEEALRRESRL